MLSNIRGWANAHPKLASWAFLAVGMVVILLIAAREVGLNGGQWFFLVLSTVGLAGLCVWIISWEDDDEVEPA